MHTIKKVMSTTKWCKGALNYSTYLLQNHIFSKKAGFKIQVVCGKGVLNYQNHSQDKSVRAEEQPSHSLKQISRDADIPLSTKAMVTVKHKVAFNENYQNHNWTFADTCGNCCNTKFSYHNC